MRLGLKELKQTQPAKCQIYRIYQMKLTGQLTSA
jgi:hypothetical protein